MESSLLYPTRAARFYAARRLRLQNSYAYWSQIVCAICLIFWSMRPAFGFSSPVSIDFYAAFASIAILAMTLAQQAAGYIDQARSLEASARRIDSIRRDLSAEIAAGNDLSPSSIKLIGRKYSKALEEFPVNHTALDHHKKSGVASFIILQLRAGALSFAVTSSVIAYPFL